MKKDERKVGYLIIASAVVWSAVMIGCAFVLKGTPYDWDVFYILMAGSFFHLLFICGPLSILQAKKNKKDKTH